MNNEPKKNIIEELLKNLNQKKYEELIKKISNLQIEYPKSIFLLNLLGVINGELNNFDDAIKYFKKIIKLNKNFADAYYNLGILYKKINKIDESINSYIECIKIKPEKFEAYNNLGNIYRDKNQIEEAIKKYLQCLEINSNYLIALQNFGVCLQSFYFTYKSKIIDKYIIKLLEENNILRPVDIIYSLINYLYLDPKFKIITEQVDNLEEKFSIEDLIDIILNIKILTSLIKITPITDLKIEKILRYLRKEILLNISTIRNKKSSFELINLIARQCFINEYLYPVEIKEEKAIKKLEESILDNLKKNNYENKFLEISCLAAYKPLNFYKWSDEILKLEEISELVNQQIVEPRTEKSLKNKILSKDIHNIVSLKVKNQYENNPYPRWTKIALNNDPKKVLNFINNLNLRINENEIKNWRNISVLVAGCGTGQHAIATATKYKNSFVTAIDLSSKSLSYAKIKANELKIQNIEFIQMDILDLKKLNKKFNIIESVGVLHHMEKPILGWKILNDCLKTNGLMMIGLYSNLARQHIKKIKSKIQKTKINIDNKTIKNFREKIIESNLYEYKIIKESTDFYSLSNLRDLLFHSKEHVFTLSDIKTYLKNLNLKFCGFENFNLTNKFRKKYKLENDIYNLDLWNKFEIENPRSFAGMYQFWCQKN